MAPSRERGVTEDELRRLLKVSSPGLRVIIETMVATGARYAEMLAPTPGGRRALREELEATAGRARMRSVSFYEFRWLAAERASKGHPLRTFLRKGK